MRPACSLLNRSSVFRFRIADRFEKDSMLWMTSPRNFLRSLWIVSRLGGVWGVQGRSSFAG